MVGRAVPLVAKDRGRIHGSHVACDTATHSHDGTALWGGGGAVSQGACEVVQEVGLAQGWEEDQAMVSFAVLPCVGETPLVPFGRVIPLLKAEDSCYQLVGHGLSDHWDQGSTDQHCRHRYQQLPSFDWSPTSQDVEMERVPTASKWN